MLDQCIIRVTCPVVVNPKVFTEKGFRIGNAVLPSAKSGFKHHSREPRDEPTGPYDDDADRFDQDDAADAADVDLKLERRCSGRIDIFEDNALVVFTRPTPNPSWSESEPTNDEHYVDRILLNPAKILHGHNGHTLQTEAALCLALTYVRCALSEILPKSKDSIKLIPGLTQVPGSYWESMEIAMNIRDEGKEIFRQMANMRNPDIRSRTVREENTVYQRGTRFTLKAYDKVAHLKTKRKPKLNIRADNEAITRLELVAKAEGLKLFPGMAEPDGATYFPFGACRRLVSFNMSYLRNLHREKFSALKAVYVKDPGSKKPKEGYGALLAALSLQRDIPVADIVEIYAATVKRSDAACRTLRIAIEDSISNSSTLNSKDLLCDANYLNQPGVSVSGERPYSIRLPEVIAPDPEITGPYATKKGVSQTKFFNDLADYMPRTTRR